MFSRITRRRACACYASPTDGGGPVRPLHHRASAEASWFFFRSPMGHGAAAQRDLCPHRAPFRRTGWPEPRRVQSSTPASETARAERPPPTGVGFPALPKTRPPHLNIACPCSVRGSSAWTKQVAVPIVRHHVQRERDGTACEAISGFDDHLARAK